MSTSTNRVSAAAKQAPLLPHMQKTMAAFAKDPFAAGPLALISEQAKRGISVANDISRTEDLREKARQEVRWNTELTQKEKTRALFTIDALKAEDVNRLDTDMRTVGPVGLFSDSEWIRRDLELGMKG